MSKIKVSNICGLVAAVGAVSFVGISLNKANEVSNNNKMIYSSLSGIYTGLGGDYNLVEDNVIPVGDVSYKVVVDEFIDQNGMDNSDIAYKETGDNVEYVDASFSEWVEIDPVLVSEYSDEAVSFKWNSESGKLFMRELAVDKVLVK